MSRLDYNVFALFRESKMKDVIFLLMRTRTDGQTDGRTDGAPDREQTVNDTSSIRHLLRSSSHDDLDTYSRVAKDAYYLVPYVTSRAIRVIVRAVFSFSGNNPRCVVNGKT